MTRARLVILESPFAGDTEENLAYAKACLLDSLKRGEAPLASHLLYTQVLDDADPEDRGLGIEAGLAWGRVADATVAYIDRGMSPGMRIGIDRAIAEGRPVESRALPGPVLSLTDQLRLELEAMRRRIDTAEAELCCKDILLAELAEQRADLAVAIYDSFDGSLANAPPPIAEVWPIARAAARQVFLQAEKASAPRNQE